MLNNGTFSSLQPLKILLMNIYNDLLLRLSLETSWETFYAQMSSEMPTWPEMKSIKAVGVQVVPDTVAAPTLSSARVRGVAFRVGPADPQVGRLASHKVVHLVNYQLEIPLLILSRTLCNAKENVGPHTGGDKRGRSVYETGAFHRSKEKRFIGKLTIRVDSILLTKPHFLILIAKLFTTNFHQVSKCCPAETSWDFGRSTNKHRSINSTSMNKVTKGLLFYLWTSLISRVWRSRSLLGSRLSQIRFWLALTATPLQTQREHRTSRI